MAFTRETYDRLCEAWSSLVTEEMTIVVELDAGPNLVEVVHGELGGLAWRAGDVEFQVPGTVNESPVTRWTAYNDHFEPVFEQVVRGTFVRGGDVLKLNDLHCQIDLPFAPSRLDEDRRLIETGEF